ncbi:protealysin inhibitor emfourin [Kribbella sp. NPDC023972]|uniref:protealysin inhibitor emfourin n=1 Tax=Kribbella sp. NPDC023972 TaxID=3154795 RepID=UPI0033C7284B
MIITVTRSGGFAGLTAHGELDTTFQPDAARLEAAVHALDQARLGSGLPQPDRFVYRVEVRDAPGSDAAHLTIAEQDLDQTTAWLLERVLES